MKLVLRRVLGKMVSSRRCSPKGKNRKSDLDSSEDMSSDSFSDEEAGQAPLLHLPEGWSAIQNVKSTMLHLHKEGGAALKCGPWISHNFVRMDRPTTAWVRCSKCFA